VLSFPAITTETFNVKSVYFPSLTLKQPLLRLFYYGLYKKRPSKRAQLRLTKTDYLFLYTNINRGDPIFSDAICNYVSVIL
jgi:hypothetical protein